jgi:hypothetical protein
VTQAQGALGMGDMAAQLNQANFGQAQAAASQDINTNLTAQQANQAAQQNQAGLNLQAASGLGVLGQQAQLSQARNFTEQATAGAQEQQQAQNEINANIANYQQAWNYPYQQLGVLQSALGMTPYGQATQGQSTTDTSYSPNIAQTALGGLQTLGSLFGSGGMFGAAGAFAGVSDRRLKTDIAKVGKHPAGVPIYAYRYKGDPKRYPKVVGPMAEDVMKIAPHAVMPIPGSGGKMGIHMGALNALAPPASQRPPLGGLAMGAALARVPRGMGFTAGPRGGAGPTAMPPPGLGMGPPVPGPLSAPGVAGAIGAMGRTMRPRRRAGAGA